jgi:hypothetical protein
VSLYPDENVHEVVVDGVTHRIVIGRCVRNYEPIICTGLCHTRSCPTWEIWLQSASPQSGGGE